MSPRTRVALLVAVLAAVAAGATVTATVLIWGGDSHAARQVGLRPGAPPFLLDELGLRNDPEAQRLRRAERLYGRGDRTAAGRLLAGDKSVGARIGAALARWPRATITELDGLAHSNPRSAFVRLHLGLALAWARRDAEARQAWRVAERVGPDSPSAVRAESLLHPELAPGLPVFVPSFGPPSTFPASPQAQLAVLARDARRPDWRAKILYGVALQRLERPVSAERQYAAAAVLAPNEPEARVAAAVGLFDKEQPSLAFAQLGPLAQTFPHAQTVRFHLGLLLLWIGQVQTARKELRLARAEGPKTLLGSQAAALLSRLGH
jgi:tetratricopeptide (TPR) repeat protein